MYLEGVFMTLVGDVLVRENELVEVSYHSGEREGYGG